MLMAGFIIIFYTAGQFLFLGISVILLAVLIHITAGILMKSSMNGLYKRVVEMTLLFFLVLFFGTIALDFMGLIQITLWAIF